MTLGTRLKNGRFIDEVSANIVMNNEFKDSGLVVEIQQNKNLFTVRRAHDQALALNAYNTNAEIYKRLQGGRSATTLTVKNLLKSKKMSLPRCLINEL